MLSSGTKAVPSPACLRCQLRRVLHHLRPLPSTHPRPATAHRTFSTTYSRHNADSGNSGITLPARENASGVYYKHIGPGGRIVGKRGRKQRQTSEALATNSLGEKSSIVVFRDVLQARKTPAPIDEQKESNYVDLGKQSLKGLSLTAEEIEAALSGTGQSPDEEEVTKSMDALRPQAPVIEGKEFDRLVKELLDSYNLKQLSRYLSQSLKSHHASTTVVRELEYRAQPNSRSPTPKKRTISFTRSRWQPGRTPLDERRTSVIAATAPSRRRETPKARAAHRIVRVAWEITTKEEEQRVGELEVQMLPWALAMFFDVVRDGKPMYQSLIEPQLLLSRSEIRPYRLDNIIRITARRQDADEIATQLENHVLLIGKQVLPVDKLVSASGVTSPKGQSLQLFRQQDLTEITRRTQSVFLHQSDGSIGIYSFKQSDRANARRLLLSLLDLTSRNNRRATLDPSTYQPTEAGPVTLALVPVFPEKALHFRDRSKTLVRAMVPIKRGSSTISAELSYSDQAEVMSRNISPLIESFDQKIEEEPSKTAERSTGSPKYWKGMTSGTWWVHLGLLLRESTLQKSGSLLQDNALDARANDSTKDSSQKFVFLRQVPGYEALLSYFEPNRRPAHPTVDGADQAPRANSDLVARKSTIVAHFIPNPFSHRGALDLFPKLELTMLRRFDSVSEETDIKIDGLRAVTEEHHIDIPLPDRVIDVRLTRKISAYAEMSAVLADPQIQQFVAALKQSANSKGPLQGKTEMNFKVPGWMNETDSEIRNARDDSLPDVDVPYLFDRFEQVQSTGFSKNFGVLKRRAEHSAGVHAFNENFPKHARLQYGEIEAGDIGGKQTDISFKVHKPQALTNQETEADEPKAIQSQQSGLDMKTILVPALAIADFVTRVCKQEITEWRQSSGLKGTDGDFRYMEQLKDHAVKETQGDEQTSGEARENDGVE